MNADAVRRRFTALKREAAREWARLMRRREARGKPDTRDSWRGIAIGLLRGAALAVVLLALPFVALVRAGMYFYTVHGLPTWLALAGGAAVTLGILTAYAAWVSRRFTGRARTVLVARWVALPLVASWCLYALIHLASLNAKSAAVRAEYRATHPLLRVALSTWFLADGELVVTDLARRPEDYGRMGLPENPRTAHARQADGWAHAVDLRTSGRSPITNVFTALYFRAMGFRTSRHGGTGDHLHVAMPAR